MNETSEQSQHDHPSEHHEVHITINGTRFPIHRGAHTGLALRQLAGFPSTYSLQLLPDLREIAPGDQLTIKGGEKFSCHEPMGQAS